jgi:hypothetical protein
MRKGIYEGGTAIIKEGAFREEGGHSRQRAT